MNFNILTLVKKKVKVVVSNCEKIEGVLQRVFDDYLVVETGSGEKTMISRNSVLLVSQSDGIDDYKGDG